jgi:hypothetical protein
MLSRRFLVIVALVTTATAFFLLGNLRATTSVASERAGYEAQLDAIRAELRAQGPARPVARPRATAGTLSAGTAATPPAPEDAERARMVQEIKQQLQTEMGLMPVHLLRERRSSFVELYTTDNFDKTSYGTAGYLGGGYFITVKHAVVALKDEDDRQATPRKIVSMRIVYQGQELAARLVDAGDADVEVHSGDWAIIRTKEVDLPPLRPNTSFGYDFAEPIFRLGNDYSKGIILSTGYVGQKTSNGLITCLTDGHPGVSGGGVLNQDGDLVGIPIGRMQGDYRFSFILPLRNEMLRKVRIVPDTQLASAGGGR